MHLVVDRNTDFVCREAVPRLSCFAGYRHRTGSHPLNLSRSLGLITGATVMGAVFAAASQAADIKAVLPSAVAIGMQITFAVAAVLVAAALFIAIASRAQAPRH
jgi:hypothetical protein